MLRRDVFGKFDSERQYQIRRWGVRQADGSFTEVPKSIEEYVLYMEDYLHEARHQLSRLPEPEARDVALDTLRKVVTLGIACFEQHGVKGRNPNALVINGRDGQPA
jgi:hypothetical protein